MFMLIGFGIILGMLLQIALDYNRICQRHREKEQDETALRTQENIIINQQHALNAERDENARLSALLAMEQAERTPPVDFTRYAALTPYHRVDTTRMH